MKFEVVRSEVFANACKRAQMMREASKLKYFFLFFSKYRGSLLLTIREAPGLGGCYNTIQLTGPLQVYWDAMIHSQQINVYHNPRSHCENAIFV
jgi:hypothetical protein